MDNSSFVSSSLQILGSIASLAAIPLSVFLYLRSREANAGKLRRDVVRILSHQIGEGRLLSTFEVQAVIESKSREHGLRGVSVSMDVIIEDLVTDTITNPMLQSERKQQIVENLRYLHGNSIIYRLITRYSISPRSLAECISAEFTLTPEDSSLIESHSTEDLAPTSARSWRYMQAFSELFALIVSLITVFSFTVSETVLKNLFNSITQISRPLLEIGIGAFGSLIAAMIAYLISRYKEHDNKKHDSSEKAKANKG